MKVEIIVDPSRVAAAPLHARLGVAPRLVFHFCFLLSKNGQVKLTIFYSLFSTVAAAGGAARQPRNAVPVAAGAVRGGKGGRGGRGGKKGGNARPKATLESLDAEMSDYNAKPVV